MFMEKLFNQQPGKPPSKDLAGEVKAGIPEWIANLRANPTPGTLGQWPKAPGSTTAAAPAPDPNVLMAQRLAQIMQPIPKQPIPGGGLNVGAFMPPK